VGSHDPTPQTGHGTAFSDFTGGPAAGSWRLCVGDSSSGDDGTLEMWALHLTLASQCFVETTGDNITDFASPNARALQTAVDQANPGDLLKVAGTCAAVSSRAGLTQTLYISQSVTLQGGYTLTNWLAAPDPATYPTTLNAQGSGRVIYTNLATPNPITLNFLNITGGHVVGSGGGVWNDGSVLTISNTAVFNNIASDGGGIYNNGILHSLHNTLSANRAPLGYGGGLYNSGQITITGGTVHHNESVLAGGGLYNSAQMLVSAAAIYSNTTKLYGGGIENEGGTLTLSAAEVLSNASILDGGGLDNWSGGTAVLLNTTIRANRSITTLGGGIWNESQLTILDSTISDNAAVDEGGGIWNGGSTQIIGSALLGNTATDGGGIWNANAVEMINSTVSGNTVWEDGAGIYHAAGGGELLAARVRTPALVPVLDTLTLNHVTIISNTADLNSNGGDGGGLLVLSGTTYISNSIIAANLDPTPIGMTDCAVMGATAVSGGHNILGTGCTFASGTDITTAAPLLAPLADNGGSTLTHLPLAFSPAIDQVPLAACTVNSDQRGIPRPVDSACDSGAVELTTNFAPAATADSYTTTEDTPLLITGPGVLANDVDGDWDVLTAVLNTTTSSGTLSLTSSGGFTYTPAANFCGTDGFTYHAHDGQASSNIATVALTITCVNDAPIAANDSYTTTEDTLLTVVAPGVLGNDSDAEGDGLTAVLSTPTSSGTLNLSSDGSFTYNPAANFCGPDSFTYLANDSQANSTPATVTIETECVNDAPTAANDTYVTPEDVPINAPAPGVLGNDGDVDGDGLTAVLDTSVVSGTLTLNSNGSFHYVPNSGICGLDGFTYHAFDGQLNSNTVTVTLNVSCFNNAPIAASDVYTVTEDSLNNVLPVMDNDTDPDTNSLSLTAVTPPAHGTAAISGTIILYTPAPNYYGPDSFGYVVSDGQLTDTAVVSLTVTSINKPPTAVNDSYTVDENSSDNLFAVLTNDMDLDGDDLLLEAVSVPANGTATISGTVILYTPAPNYFGPDTFSYIISDGLVTDTAVVSLTVTSVNQPPTAVADSYTVAQNSSHNLFTILANDMDLDGDSLTLESVSTPAHGTATISGTLLLYTPTPDFAGADSFTYTISDGTATAVGQIAVTITPTSPAITIYLPFMSKP
ncbi:MAG: tandem-95 repeat protein, partial [Ardenticatenaceae bacterium]|nr:tandem-95 repeat protein [Ardenticatenaceae bacterium]